MLSSNPLKNKTKSLLEASISKCFAMCHGQPLSTKVNLGQLWSTFVILGQSWFNIYLMSIQCLFNFYSMSIQCLFIVYSVCNQFQFNALQYVYLIFGLWKPRICKRRGILFQIFSTWRECFYSQPKKS